MWISHIEYLDGTPTDFVEGHWSCEVTRVKGSKSCQKQKLWLTSYPVCLLLIFRSSAFISQNLVNFIISREWNVRDIILTMCIGHVKWAGPMFNGQFLSIFLHLYVLGGHERSFLVKSMLTCCFKKNKCSWPHTRDVGSHVCYDTSIYSISQGLTKPSAF